MSKEGDLGEEVQKVVNLSIAGFAKATALYADALEDFLEGHRAIMKRSGEARKRLFEIQEERTKGTKKMLDNC